jgi:tetratricopeptide (TPR) repeat protein
MSPHSDELTNRIEELESELTRDPGPGVFAPLAEACRLSGQLERAVETARRGVASYPEHVGIRVVLARAIADLEGGERAVEAYRDVLDRDIGNLEARAFIDESERARPAAEPHPTGGEQPALREDGETAGTERAVGSLSDELAHLADLFVPSSGSPQGQTISPEAIATLTLAEIYARQGLHGKAAEVCERILERDPDNEEARAALEDYRKRPASV